MGAKSNPPHNHRCISNNIVHAHSYIQQSGRSVKRMNAKNRQQITDSWECGHKNQSLKICHRRLIMLICSRMSLEHTTENMASLTGPLIKWYLRQKKQRRACSSPDLNLAQHVNIDSCNLDCTFRRSNAASGSEYWDFLHTLLCSKFRLQKRYGRQVWLPLAAATTAFE